MLLIFNWNSKYHWTYYFTTCYPRWSWPPWFSADHKELSYDTGVWPWCRLIYFGPQWYVWIYQRVSYVTKRIICLGWTIPRINRLSWYGRYCGSRKLWKVFWHLWSVIGAEVCIPDEQETKMMSRVTNDVKYNESKPRGIEQNTFFAHNSLYEITFTKGLTEYLTANLISDNIISQVDSKEHHYQVLKEISEHYADVSALKRSDGFIRSRGGNLHS